MSTSSAIADPSFDEFYSEVSIFCGLARFVVSDMTEEYVVKANFVLINIFFWFLGKRDWKAWLCIDTETTNRSITTPRFDLFQFEPLWSAAVGARMHSGGNQEEIQAVIHSCASWQEYGEWLWGDCCLACRGDTFGWFSFCYTCKQVGRSDFL